jgi:hypothetical protein
MGKSITVHVLGYTANSGLYCCMNRLEMRQAMARAERLGEKIIEWASQTKVGERILGGDCWRVTSEIISLLPKVVSCPICDGGGCIVCNWSGVTTPGYWHKWDNWQLRQIRDNALANSEKIIPRED